MDSKTFQTVNIDNKYHSNVSYDTIRQTILAICSEEYKDICLKVEEIFDDVSDLYEGKWENYSACDTGYHNFEHIAEVTLAAVRMMAGWNMANPSKKIPADYFIIGFISAMFHDSGYIKDRDDNEGTGAKYTYTHVERSVRIAREYLINKNWDENTINLVALVIGKTEFNEQISLKDLEKDENLSIVAKIVGTADLIAQVADVFYLERLPLLFAEFSEAYDFEGREKLAQKGVRIYSSVQEILSETVSFVENFVIPRFELFGRMDRYLTVFFKTNRNPYLESISANLYRSIIYDRITWLKVGDILKEFNLVDDKKINEALFIQNALRGSKCETLPKNRDIRDLLGDYVFLLSWIDENSGCYNIGEILTKMGVIGPEELHNAIKNQILPENVFKWLQPADFECLLKTAMLLINMKRTPQVLHTCLEMICNHIPCDAGSILIADEKRQELVMTVVTGPKRKELLGLRLPWNKGVAGWVYNHAQWAVVNRTLWDNRFFDEVDRLSGYKTNSILATPLVDDGKIMGIIELINKDNGDGIFNERDLAMLHLFSIQTAGLIDTIQWIVKNL